MSDHPAFVGIWRDDVRSRAAYSEGAGIFRIVPRAIAIPSTTTAVVDLVRWAAATGTALIPRGAGSGMVGGNVGEGVLVDLTALDGAPLAIDPRTCLARAGAAVSLGALQQAAERHGLRMPVDPSSERWVTCGGAVGTNAAGTRTVKYGAVRRWVQGVTLVTADGELVELERGHPPTDSKLVERLRDGLADTLRLARWRVASTFPKVRKNTAGYGLDAFLESGDLVDLVIGAEGTLGIVTEVRWRLSPIPAQVAGLRAALREGRRLSHLVPALLELGPSRLEFLDGTFLRFVEDSVLALPHGDRIAKAGALLMVEFEGDDAAGLANDLERAVGIVRNDSVEVTVGRNEPEIESLWAIRRAASPKLASLGVERRSLQVIEDGCVPIARLGEYLAAVDAIAGQRDVTAVMFGHAGDGNVHVNLLPDVTAPGWLDRIRAIFEDVSQLVVAMGGTPSGEHGDGRLRAGLVERVFGFEVNQVFRQIKRAFDPAGIMNPGVKLGPGAEFQHLKVGEAAAAIPADIEAGLRRIERTGGYAAARLALADDPLVRDEATNGAEAR
ncbi:MAG: FAD-binding oxidoreductase [Gemmatimonadales bacterium]